MSALDKVYARLPVAAQHAAVTAFGAYWHWLRFGPGYGASVAAYRANEQLRGDAWRERVAAALGRVLTVAVDEVPYYRDRWSEAEKRAARAGRLDALPMTGKDPLRADPQAFVRVGARGRKLVFHTSGSTGTPIQSIWSIRELRDSLALREVRSANWAGVSFREPRATFSGRMVEPDPESRGPFHRYNAIERQVYLSAFHLRPDTAAHYVEALRRHRVRWMTGYAVSYYLLAKLILDQGLKVPPLGAVITTSEKLTGEMRATMERAYGCRIYEEYSTVENAVFASECRAGSLHVSEDAGIIEIVRPDGTPCAPGEAGEVVATCLMRTLQPLVRFRLSDMAVWNPDPCACGLPMPVLREVVGRIEDVIIGPDGRQMVRFHGIFTDQPHVREGQIVQESLTSILVNVAPTPGFGADDVASIVGRVQQRVGPGIAVRVQTMESIPRTRAGKFQAVVSLLRAQGIAAAEQTGVEPAPPAEGA